MRLKISVVIRAQEIFPVLDKANRRKRQQTVNILPARELQSTTAESSSPKPKQIQLMCHISLARYIAQIQLLSCIFPSSLQLCIKCIKALTFKKTKKKTDLKCLLCTDTLLQFTQWPQPSFYFHHSTLGI